ASLREDTRRRFELDLDIEVIPNFVDTTRFAPCPRKVGGPPRLIHVSNFRPVKRIDSLISIFEIIARRSDARLVLVGDGPELGPAERRLRELGLRDRAELHGHRHDLPPLLCDSDVFLLPSQTESFGVAALEAMACGVPVVASDVGGLPEVITDGETGYLCPVGDVQRFAERTLSLIEDPARREAMGHLARQHAATRFGMAVALDRYEAMYQRLIG
ncbi:MAG TPA: glycosyltransferase, partial [Myxococcota bacterium]|nr:glycosyltransferase [Myxococcota bacterium]